MWLALLSALLVVYRTEAPSPTEQGLGAAYQSTKSLAALRTCLTDKLADVGEVVAVKLDKDTTTLVLRDIADGPMTIDLAPPSVTVTSKLLPRTRHLIEACL